MGEPEKTLDRIDRINRIQENSSLDPVDPVIRSGFAGCFTSSCPSARLRGRFVPITDGRQE
jgi:hypothetical protein